MTIERNEKFAVNENGVINQKQRNDLRKRVEAQVQDILSNVLTDYSFTLTTEGIVMEIPNDELGAIPVVVSVKVKNINFDVLTASDEYIEKQEKAKAREAEKEAKAKEREKTANK